jgi:opacity protein-like surface antigen
VPLHRIVLAALLALACVFITPDSRAEDSRSEGNAYVGMDVTMATLDISNATFAPTTLRGRLGLTILPEMVPAISLESHLGFGVTDDTQTIQGADVTLKLATYLGFYVRGDFKVMEDATAYLLLGMASAQLSGPLGSGGLPNDDTEAGYSYGVGATYQLPWDLKAYLEYASIVDGDNFTVTGIGLGVTRALN